MRHYKQAQKIFEQVITLENDLIHDYLQIKCGEDPALLNTVLDLVNSHQNIASDSKVSIETHIFKLLSTTSATNNINNTQQQNIQFSNERYQMIEKIGDGGMGSVYLCLRKHEGFTQKVAIKILNKVEYSTEIIQRFNQEKQILAQLEHLNITQFIDTDYLSDGTPFVVMEYTPGLPIDDYSSQHQLTTKQKLALFLQLCEAVQHAHKNLIIHRDLKPSNVLVTKTGTVKLIDFGIAKDLSDRNSLQTQTGHHVMTPAYASPEQLLKKPLNTATDVYSLGLILYELLTSTRPHDLSKLSPGQYEKLLFNTSAEAPSKRSNDISADLDAITLKAIQTEVNDRYPSVAELAADLKRHQQHLPVLARKPNFIYKTRKFIKRNRLAMLTTLSFCALTLVFIMQIINQKNNAEKERIKAKTISDSFILAFKNADPTQTLGENIKAIHILDQASNIIATSHAENPVLLTELSYTMAEVYFNMGSYDQALKIIDLALQSQGALSPIQTTEWMLLKAKVENNTGLYDDALNTVADAKAHSHDQELHMEYTKAYALTAKGDSVDAKTIFDQLDPHIKNDHPLYSEMCLTRFTLQHAQDEVSEQEELLDSCLNKQAKISNQQQLINNQIMLRLAKSHQSKGNIEQSNKYYLNSLEITKKIFGEQHISQTSAYKGLGWNYMQQEKFDDSIESQSQALAISEKYFGKGHPNTTNAIFNLGHVYATLENHDQAFENYNLVINIMLKHDLTEARKLAFYYKSLGHLQNDLAMYTDAENNIRNSIRIFKLKQGGFIYRAAEMQVLLSHIYHNQGKDHDARLVLAEALPNMYTMHKAGDYYQLLGEELDARLNNKQLDQAYAILVNE